MQRFICFAALLGLAGCGGQGDGRYAGTMQMTQGVCGPGYAAGQPAQATLVLRNTQAEFVPNDGVSILTGTVSSTGAVHVADTAPGVDHKPFVQVFEGERKGDTITGSYATPRCRASVTLTRR